MGEIRFRAILPVAQCTCAVLFGGFGLWIRDFYLSRPLFQGTWWDSSLRFHLWPYPLKFEIVINFPAFLAGGLLSWPVVEHWQGLPEWVDALPTLIPVALLWYWIGRWFERHWSPDEPPSSQKYPWIVLLLFTLLCAGGAKVEIQSTSEYVVSGALIWMVVGCLFAGSALRSKLRRLIEV